jgi:hypothetical protein
MRKLILLAAAALLLYVASPPAAVAAPPPVDELALGAMPVPPVQELALACAPCGSKLCCGSNRKTVRMEGPVEIDGRSSCDGGSAICFTVKGKVVWDFPALPDPAGLLTVGNHLCAESSATASLPGCTFNDTLQLGIDQALPNAFGTVNAYLSSAENAKIRACGFLNDAGSFNMPDASYTVRCTR